MSISEIYCPHGLYFAPMEGVTDALYREVIHTLWPEWDYYCTDFLRIPKHGNYPKHLVFDHFGKGNYERMEERKKTGYQILSTDEVDDSLVLGFIQELEIPHLDLNLGCPSKKVNSHRGGAYLLSDPEALSTLVSRIRRQFKGFFTVKIRVGLKDDTRFEDNLLLLQDLGVDAITIHARTRDQLYQGRADWKYIKRAVEICSVPIIGNGDVWTVDDIDEMFSTTGCHGIMIGRGALKTPWLATLYRQRLSHNEAQLLSLRVAFLQEYFEGLEKAYRKIDFTQEQILKRFKSYSRYLFDDFPNFEIVRGRFLRSTSLEIFQEHLYRL
jgi:tRNA-dihydrouridine synthase B